MHNIDRTVDEMEFLNEFEQEFGNEFESSYETEQEEEFESESEFESDTEFEDQQGEYSGEYEDTEFESENESSEMELATELLSVSNEDEMEEFLGKLFKKVKNAAGNFIKSPAGNLLKNYLKGLAKKALPIAGSALGGIVGGPIGAQLSSSATQMVGKALGLELEGLSPEDKEFEIARGYVRLAKDAIHRTASDPNRRHSHRSVARSAITNAARKHAPGFLSPQFADNFHRHIHGRRRTRGTWAMQKNGTIVLYGL